jgi:hypothetical protein
MHLKAAGRMILTTLTLSPLTRRRNIEVVFGRIKINSFKSNSGSRWAATNICERQYYRTS